MAEVTITLNGKEIKCDSNRTILDVARQEGIKIPTLCHDEKLHPFGSCWVCLVEVKGARGFVPSCATKLTNNMVIDTESEKVVSARKLALELLLSAHYGDCIAPCQGACPGGADAQGYVALIANGMDADALRLIKQTLPLPATLGRVCPHPCETECRRNLVEEPIAICYLKRHAADEDLKQDKPYLPPVASDTGKTVAVVGAGPAGLTAAYYLRQMGHKVTIYEALPKSGGWLRYGIPEYRLPKALLDREISTITALGVEIRYNQKLGQDITLDGLRNSHDAVFLGFGAHSSYKMKIKNEEAPGAWSGIDFLKRFVLGEKVTVGEHVAVIGGGNTAIDAARTSLRLGAKEVTIVYRRSEEEMPANPLEIEEAKKEGVKFMFLTAPKDAVLDANGHVASINCFKMTLGEPDASGRRRPVPQENSDFNMVANTVIGCIGQAPDLNCVSGNSDLKVSTRATIETDPDTGATSIPGVFAAGDLVTGAATVVEAIGGAHKAANAIDTYFRTGKVVKPVKKFNISKGKIDEVAKDLFVHVKKDKRAQMPMLTEAQRHHSFAEVDLGFAEKNARKEAKRCLECGCADVFECKLREYATQYETHFNRFWGELKRHPIDESHPFLVRDQNKCVMCGRCVRMCMEVVGASALGFVYRGFGAIVAPAMNKPYPESSCVSCGACIETCPVGALTEKVRILKPAPWKSNAVPSVCSYCGVGCQLECQVEDDHLVKITGKKITPFNIGNLCFKGKFGYEYAQNGERALLPMVNKKGKLKDADWSVAVPSAKAAIEEAVRHHGADAVAFFASGRSSCEELEHLRAWGEKLGVKTFSTLSCAGRERVTKILSGGSGYQSLESADTILLVGSGLYCENPIASQKVRNAVTRGAKLISIHEHATKLGKDIAEKEFVVKSGTMNLALNSVLHGLAKSAESVLDGYREMKKALSKFSLDSACKATGLSKDDIHHLTQAVTFGKNVVVVVNADGVDAESAKAISNILHLIDKPNSYIAMRAKANANGVDRFLSVETDEVLALMKKGKIKAAFLLNEDPLGAPVDGVNLRPILAKVEKIVVSDVFFTKTAELAEVFLPASSPFESEGSFISSEGKRQYFQQAISPRSYYTTSRLLAELSGRNDREELPTLNAPKAGFLTPTLKKAERPMKGYSCDVLEKWVSDLKEKEGLCHKCHK